MISMTSIDVVDYRSSACLDAELADLCYAVVRGWPDQRPTTASLVRSWLRPKGLTATTLALHHDADGRLDGAAALRWPGTSEATAHLWGPIVHPSTRRVGLGSALLSALVAVVAARPGVRVTTVAIPETRKAGWALYENAGWRWSGGACLLQRALPADTPPSTAVPVRTIRAGEYIAPALARLCADARPHVAYATARDTYSWWTADDRYKPDGLLLAEDASGLLGAALVYPLRHGCAAQANGFDVGDDDVGDDDEGHGEDEPAEDEPAEAQLADLITSTRLDDTVAARVTAALVGAFLRAGTGMGATVARAEAEDPGLADALLATGFEVADHVRYYTRPAA
jgi:GNAT superfamily N-acetyltransferase